MKEKQAEDFWLQLQHLKRLEIIIPNFLQQEQKKKCDQSLTFLKFMKELGSHGKLSAPQT